MDSKKVSFKEDDLDDLEFETDSENGADLDDGDLAKISAGADRELIKINSFSNGNVV